MSDLLTSVDLLAPEIILGRTIVRQPLPVVVARMRHLRHPH